MNPLLTTGLDAHRGHTALSVNLNKVALLRNQRTLGIPSVTRAATVSLEAGAQGITVHPRPDKRHIRTHDVHDWDSAHVPVQAELTIGGRLQKVVMVANRNGFFYTLNRETGKLLVAKPFIDGSNWAKEIGADGRPQVNVKNG